MRLFLAIVIVLNSFVLIGQEIECDGAFYLVVYTESEGKSRLYKITGENYSYNYQEIPLSESRRLTALNYNLNDKHLYALDVNSLEVIKIEGDGNITSLGVPDNIDTSLEYSSGTFSPQSGGMLFSGFDPILQKDTKMYGLNFDRFYAGDLGVTGAFPVKITDLATDPMTGVIYGFNSLRATLMQTSISGGTTSYQYSAVQSSDIDALFFNPLGELYGYSPSSGLYAIDKSTGEINSLGKVVEGTHADACSCPYTFEFTKEITPKEIIPCEEFIVEYKFSNQMAIGQIVEEFRDTFPEGFEITNIETDLISTFSTVLPTEKNIIAIDLFIYLVGDNSIKLTVKAPENFRGEFGSSAIQSEFALAFSKQMKSDNPETETKADPTTASVISESEIDFTKSISYSCDGTSALVSSPISADTYLWSTGELDSIIEINEPGVYSLMTSNACLTYFDSIEIVDFPDARSFSLGEDKDIIQGETVNLEPDIAKGKISSIEWYVNEQKYNCENCHGLSLTPHEDSQVTAIMIDSDGCELEDNLEIRVKVIRDIFQPNVFTPNDDGVNDMFFLQTATVATVQEMKIYNRWGNLVYQKSNFPTNDQSEGWDGKLSANPMHNQVFVYIAVVVHPDGTKEELSGEVLMISN